jgi:hypothetical protein
MNFQIMETAARNGKPIWDTLVVIAGGAGFLFQSALSVEIQTWAQIFGGFGIGTFALIRAYYWVMNDGYEDGAP